MLQACEFYVLRRPLEHHNMAHQAFIACSTASIIEIFDDWYVKALFCTTDDLSSF